MPSIRLVASQAVAAVAGPRAQSRLASTSKASPKSLAYGSPGNGSTPPLAIELFERAAGIQPD